MSEKTYIGVVPSGLSTLYDFNDKGQMVQNYILYMLARTNRMFEYNGLPDSIPQRNLETMLQTNGNVAFVKVSNELYAMTGGFGGEPDPYNMPTIYTVSNPALKFSKNLKIGSECVVVPSDSMYVGLIPMFRQYATMLVENDITMRLADINSRVVALISAGDDKTRVAAEKFLEDIVNGKLGAIGENPFLEGVKAQPYNSSTGSSTITNLIEYHQYLKAGWYNDLGLNSNYNMKREAINSNESQLNRDALLPLVDDMLHHREEGVKKVNEMFGTDISVKLASSWEEIHNEEETQVTEDLGQPKTEEEEVKEDGEKDTVTGDSE